MGKMCAPIIYVAAQLKLVVAIDVRIGRSANYTCLHSKQFFGATFQLWCVGLVEASVRTGYSTIELRIDVVECCVFVLARFPDGMSSTTSFFPEQVRNTLVRMTKFMQCTL